DELGAGPGVSIAVDLPRHWLTAVWWLAIDAAGGTAKFGPHTTEEIAVVGPDKAMTPPAADEVVAVSLSPLAGPFTDPLPPLVRDYATEVRQQGDHFAPAHKGDAAAGDRAQRQAGAWGLTATDRVLAVGALQTAVDLEQALLAPMAADASVVWVRNPAGPHLVKTATAERVTVGVGEPPDGAPSIPGVRWLPKLSVSC
ncbi:MAG TPA: TIGR03089 family protein, partial [Actinomycetes bacterium]|nr:TIGR03089 family protein [Actinomycetes bacterium]